MDARKERAPVIAIAGDVETMVMDVSSLEEMNPYQFFQAASLYTARLVNPAQAQAVIGMASMANAAPNAFGAQLAYPGRQTIAICGDGGFTMLGMGDLLTQMERKTPVIHTLLNNGSLDFVNIEQQEAGYIPVGVGFQNPERRGRGRSNGRERDSN